MTYSEQGPQRIDLTQLSDTELENIDTLVALLIRRERTLAKDPSLHTNDHRSSHTNEANDP